MMTLVEMSVLSYIFKSIKVILQSPGKLSNLSGIDVRFQPYLSIHEKSKNKKKTTNKLWPLNLSSHQRKVIVYFFFPKSIYSFSEVPELYSTIKANFRMS